MTRMTWAMLGGISAVTGGLAGSVVAGLRDHPAQLPSRTAAPNSQLQELGELGDRVAALERTLLNRDNGRRIAAVGRPSIAGMTEAQSGASESPGKGASDVGDPVFAAAVQDTVDRLDADRTAQQLAEQSQKTALVWGNQLGQALGLSEDQRRDVDELGIEIAQKAQELSTPGGDGEPVDPQKRDAQLAALRNECEQRLGSVLDAKQMGAYRELDSKTRFGFALE